ncbi:MAG: phenylalanine--tRNA ligase subunit beta [Nitrososphaera sp.]
MPVVNITFDRLKKFLPGVKQEKALEMLPFVGLDIEGIDDNTVRVEYNPNRPDFSSDYGIARALRGLVGKETGMPEFVVTKGKLAIKVERSVKKVRPYVVALAARNGRLDNETIKQIIAMQEDLHNGICRRRKKASIGIHNLDVIKFPVKYTVAGRDASFVPLGETAVMAIREILEKTDTGIAYGRLISGDKYPVITDNAGTVLSLPPIINGEVTRVDEKCRNLFVEVTATDKKTADDVLAVIAITLYDAGFAIETVTIDDGKKEVVTPDARPAKMQVDRTYINDIMGLDLGAKEIISCLKKSRLDAKASNGRVITCTIPRYRVDISHPVDLAEEVAIGYGVYDIKPAFPPASTAGQRSALSAHLDAVRQTMTGLGMLEAFNPSLASRDVLYVMSGRPPSGGTLSVDGTKSAEHEILRDSLVPQLLQSLSRNVHEEYPQRLFEIGKVFSIRDKVTEAWSVAVVTAHGEAGYTEIKSHLQALMSSAFGKPVSTKASQNPLFIKGRCADIVSDGKVVGTIGEVTPLAIDNFKLRVPVAAFEVSLSSLLPL